jgi:hypothetical protein
MRNITATEIAQRINWIGKKAAMADNYDRFRSFAERYIIARADKFKPGSEREDGWLALKDAETLYEMIGRTAQRRDAAGPLPVNPPSAIGQGCGAGNIANPGRVFPTNPPGQGTAHDNVWPRNR